MVTHGLFTENKWKKLLEMNVEKIYCTNTTPPEQHTKSSKVFALSVIPLLKNELKAD